MRTPKNWLLLPAAALALFAGPRAARAEKEGPAHTSTHLAAAQRLYQKLDLDAAMAELKEAETEARAANDENEIVTVLIYKGLIYADNGKTTEMTEYFKRALAMRPWVEVPVDTSPRLAKLFNDSRKELWGSGGQLKTPPKKKFHPPSATVAPAPAPMAAPAPTVAPAPAADSLAPPPAPAETPAPAK
jgi:tetratricopeptide (TPR) repeat protein